MLESLGVEIEFVPDGDELRSVTGIDATETENGNIARRGFRSPNEPVLRSRRGSINSLYTVDEGSFRSIRSRASMSRLETSETVLLEQRPSSRATTRKTEKTAFNSTPNKPRRSQTGRGRLTAGESVSGLDIHQRTQEIFPEPNPQVLQKPAKPSGGRVNSVGSTDIARKQAHTGDVSAEKPSEIAKASSFLQPVYYSAPYNLSRSQLLRDAEAFQDFKIRSVARDLIDKWCYAAVQAKDHHEHLARLASARDTEILLRQAFENWRIRLHSRRQAIATKRYFDHLERQTTRARDLHLLDKAFTHWLSCVREQRLRTASAREHILGVKYFHAWHKITAINQVKVRHHFVRKFWGLCKQRYIRVLEDDIKADLMRQDSVLKNAYWHWFWAFCGRQAPQWRDGRLKRKYIFGWLVAWRKSRQLSQHAIMQAEDSVVRKYFAQWREKSCIVTATQRLALVFDQQNLTANTMSTWRATARDVPIARQVSNMVDWRVARETFALFVLRYRCEKQAKRVDRQRIMRDHWTTWNDRLRCQALSQRVDDRCMLEALYKWILAERYCCLRKIWVQRLRQRCLYQIRDTWSVQNVQRERRCQTIQLKHSMRSLREILDLWRAQLDSQRALQQRAFEFHAPKTAQDVLDVFARTMKHLQMLNGWAQDAHYYFAAKQTLKRWQTAFVKSKKQKRRDAYVQVRRATKKRLAAGVLRRWHKQTVEVQDLRWQAETRLKDRLLSRGTHLFDHWRSLFEFRKHYNGQAAHHHERRLLEMCLYTWMEKLEDQAKMEDTADLNYEMRMRNIAFGFFHKLRLRMIELKGKEANAESLRKWYQKRHFHNFLKQWQNETARKRVAPLDRSSGSAETGKHRLPVRGSQERTPSPAEDRTDFDVGDWIPAIETQFNATPLPGYLSSPSKRAARAKALVRVSTTPAGTPFSHRLRSQLGTTPRTARRAGFGRSLRESTFGAISEDPPRTPEARGEG